MVIASERHGGDILSFETATMYTPENPPSAVTNALADQIGLIGELIKIFYQPRIRFTYIGFEQGNLFMQYPGQFLGKDYDFHVKVTEWYYAAANNTTRIFSASPNLVENVPNQF